MRFHRHLACRFVAFIATFVLTPAIVADIVEYRLPGTKSELVIVLQGRTKKAGQSLSYMHPKFGRLIMGVGNYRLHPTRSPKELFERKLFKAKNSDDIHDLIDLAKWCVRYGLIDEVYKTAAIMLDKDPKNEIALGIRSLYSKTHRDLGKSEKEEAYLRRAVKKSGMQIRKSAHYILIHDTADGDDVSRADERLRLLEQVYESFLLKFYTEGIRISVPKRRLKVVLFRERPDFLAFSSKLGPSMASVAGFWHMKSNLAVFFDQGESDRFKSVREAERIFQAQATYAKKNRKRIANVAEIVRSAEALTMILKIAREDADIEVVSHEATHQMAGNTGLLPRNIQIPTWVHEGLATYFEAPEDATWSGVGAVNQDRLDRYRQLDGDDKHSNVDFIVGNEIFSTAETLDATLHGYGQSWALTHFLVERHFDKYTAFLASLSKMPADQPLPASTLRKAFHTAFDVEDTTTLNHEWKSYMRQLRTDTSQIIGYERSN
jgi:hypothetical protein